MARKNDQVISIRVPRGMPEELRLLTGMPFGTVARHCLISLLNAERKKHNKESPHEQPTPDE